MFADKFDVPEKEYPLTEQIPMNPPEYYEKDMGVRYI